MRLERSPLLKEWGPSLAFKSNQVHHRIRYYGTALLFRCLVGCLVTWHSDMCRNPSEFYVPPLASKRFEYGHHVRLISNQLRISDRYSKGNTCELRTDLLATRNNERSKIVLAEIA